MTEPEMIHEKQYILLQVVPPYQNDNVKILYRTLSLYKRGSRGHQSWETSGLEISLILFTKTES